MSLGEQVRILSKKMVYRIMEAVRVSHRLKRKPNGITKAEQNAEKSDELLKRDFTSDKSFEKCVTDITEIPAKNERSMYLPSLTVMMSECLICQWQTTCGIVQSMNSNGGRYHDNARCESMWARMKEKLLYGRYDTKNMTIDELKTLI